MKEEKINQYFSEHASEWGRHYEGAGIWLRVFDGIFRRAVKQRYDLTMKNAFPVEGKTYLDVGCGTGVYSLTLAKAGAKSVTGIDFAPNMIEISSNFAREQGVEEKCNFIQGDFMKMEFTEKFDMVFAMGVFDYVENYIEFWKKMVSVSRNIAMGSFPGHTLLREPVRKFRYRYIKGFPVYFYSRHQLESLGMITEIQRYNLEKLGPGFIMTGFVK